MKRRNEKEKWQEIAKNIKEIPPIFNFAEEPLKAGLWCLYVSKNKFNKNFLNPREIENILQNYLGIPITRIQIIKAFARAGKKIISERKNYQISYLGEEYLKSLKVKRLIKIIYLAPQKPITAENSLNEVIESIKKGTLFITDPYYGLKTLKILCKFAEHHKAVYFLTAQLGGGEKVAIVNSFLKDMNKEYKNRIKIRIYPIKNELHDRYIISEDAFFIIGQGLKDLGNKESFIVVIKDRWGKDIRRILKKVFLERWNRSKILL